MRRLLLVAVLAIGISINLALLVPMVARLGDQAEEGRRAHKTQCALYPVSLKLYRAAKRYELITARELQTFVRLRPRDCPRPLKP